MTLYHSTGIIAASGGAAAKPGMVLLKPTSIAHSGTSASIGANGQVTFTAVTSLSLNGVFSADFDNYFVSIRTTVSAGVAVSARLRASSSDASGSNYTWQRLSASGSTISASRQSSVAQYQIAEIDTDRNGVNISFYGPFLAQPTAFRSMSINSLLGAILVDLAGTHSLSTSYDGFSILPNSGANITGALQVYGVRS